MASIINARGRNDALLRAASAVLVLTIAAAACSSDGRDMRPPRPDQFPTTTEGEDTTTIVAGLPGEDIDDSDGDNEGNPSGFVLTGGWPPGGLIPERHTCLGEDLSPSLRWFGVPADATHLAIVVTDPDAGGFVHWVIANIHPLLTVLAEGESPPDALEGTNDADTVGWSGPCPPEGESHRYVFELRALDQQIELPAGTPAAELLRVIDLVTVAVTTYEGSFPQS